MLGRGRSEIQRAPLTFFLLSLSVHSSGRCFRCALRWSPHMAIINLGRSLLFGQPNLLVYIYVAASVDSTFAC